MRRLLALVLMFVAVGCSVAPVIREEKPAFKGMELYSWRPDGQDWHFSVLEGTNRDKTMEEITAPEVTIVSMAALKKRLARLAIGENVFWRNLAQEPVPEEVETDLRAFCRGIEVNLEVLWHYPPATQ